MSKNNPSSKSRLPEIRDEDAPFWEAARDHELRMQRCDECDYIWWAPAPICPECWSTEYEWAELSGDGIVKSWVVIHRPYWEDVVDAIPYNVAEIELEEGPRYLSNVVEVENDELYQGMPVEVVYEEVTDEVTLPKFQPK